MTPASATARAAVRRATAGLLCVLCTLITAACVVTPVGRLDAELFPAAAGTTAPPLAGRVALVLPTTLREQVHPGPQGVREGTHRLNLPLGLIVETALQRQLGAAFAGGVQLAAVPPAAGSGFDLGVSVTAAQLQFDSRLNYMIPVPLPPFLGVVAASTDYSVRMTLDLRITDAFGRVLAAHTLDTGPLVEERGVWVAESGLEFFIRRTHVAAWRAAGLAAQAAQEAAQAELLRARPL